MDKNSVKLLIFSVEGIKSKRQAKRKLGHVVQTHFCRLLDCKTVRIFTYSSTRELSNKRSGMRLKTESETGERR